MSETDERMKAQEAQKDYLIKTLKNGIKGRIPSDDALSDLEFAKIVKTKGKKDRMP